MCENFQAGPFNNSHRMPSPSNKQSSSIQTSPNSVNMNLRSSLRMGMINNRNDVQDKDRTPPFGDFRIIHTNHGHPELGWNKNQPMAYTRLSVKEFEDNSNRKNTGVYGGAGSGDDTEDDHESNL